MADVAAELVVDVVGRESVTAVLTRLEAQLQQGDARAQELIAAMEKLGNAQQRTGTNTLALAQAQARLKAASGDTTGAIQTLQAALEGADRSSVATIRTQTQLAQLQTRLVRDTTDAGTATKSFGASVVSLLGPLGIATTGIGALLTIAGKIKEGFDLRATLDEQRRTIGTLLGDVQKGDKVFQQAAEFGKKYGFTQKEMGESAAAAAPLIKNSTTAVEKQLEVLGRLATLKPTEGFTGATFATKELASGDITSIVERFEIARSAANQMKKEIAGGADVFDVLDAQLNTMGVTVDVLKNRTEGAAGATRTYAQSQEALTLALGRMAEGPGVQALDFLAKFTDTLTSIASGSNVFGPQLAQADQIQGKLLAASTSFEDYGARVQAVNAQIDAAYANDPVAGFIAKQIGGFGQLTSIQFAYAQSLLQTGSSAAEAATQTQALAGTAETLALIQQTASSQGEATAAAFAALGPEMLQVAAIGPDAESGMLALANAFANGEVSADQFRIVLEAQIAAQETATASTLRAADADDRAAAALENTAVAANKELQAKLDSQIASANLADQQSQLEADSRLAAQGLLGAGDQAEILAQKYGIAADQAAYLIEQQRKLLAASALADQRAGERSPGSSGAAEAAAQEERRLQALYRTLQDAPTKTPKGRSGGGGGKTKLTDQQKLNNQLLANEDKANQQFEDEDRTHATALLKIQTDYAKKRLAAEQSLQQSLLDGGASFYDTLINMENQGAAQAADAQYQAFLANELPQIAAEKGADVAEAYQDAYEKVLLDRAKRQAEIEKATKEGDTGRAEALKGVDAKYRQAEEARLARIKEGNGSIADEQAKALQDENSRYAEAQGKIADSADRAAERKIGASQRAGQAIDAEQAKLDRLAATYDRIAPAGGGGNGGAGSGAPAPTPPPAPTAPAPAATSGDGGLLEALGAIRAAVDAAAEKITRAEGETTRAVKSSAQRGGVAA